MPRAQVKVDLELAGEIANYYGDPLGFVAFAYPWGEPGALRDATGPDTWQREFLEELGAEIRARAFDGVHTVAPIRASAWLAPAPIPLCFVEQGAADLGDEVEAALQIRIGMAQLVDSTIGPKWQNRQKSNPMVHPGTLCAVKPLPQGNRAACSPEA